MISGGHPDPVVAHRNANETVVVLRGQGDRARSVNGVSGVVDQIQKHLAHLVGIKHDVRQVGIVVTHQFDVRQLELPLLKPCHDLFEYLVHVAGDQTRRVLARELQQCLRNPSRLEDRRIDVGKFFPDRSPGSIAR